MQYLDNTWNLSTVSIEDLNSALAGIQVGEGHQNDEERMGTEAESAGRGSTG